MRVPSISRRSRNTGVMDEGTGRLPVETSKKFWPSMIFEVMLTTSLMYQFPELRGGKGESDTLVSRLLWHACVLTAASFAIYMSFNVSARPWNASHYTAQAGRFVVGSGLGLVYFYLAAVIFGASLTEGHAQTCLWAGSMATLCAAPLAALQITSISALTRQNAAVWLPVLCAMMGSWFGATFIPLDWDRPWQVWPLTVTAGAAYGHNLGAVLSLGLWVIFGSGEGSTHDLKSSTVPP